MIDNSSEPESTLSKPFVARFKAMPLIQANPLNSTDALKMRKELSQSSNEGHETPIIKSLFDVKGNSKFKNDKKPSASGTSQADSSSDQDEEDKEE